MNRKCAGCGNQSGFTIVEIIAVIGLLLVVILPLAKVIASSLESTNDEQHLTHCAFLAQQKVEEVRTRANCYTDLAAGCPVSAGSDDFSQNFNQSYFPSVAPCSFPSPFDDYKCTVQYDSINGTGGRQKTIQVRVWYDKDGDNIFDADISEPDVFVETRLTLRSPAW
ncbi:MAG TPA: hypothetical protein PLN69_04235 [bacterium]|nr:hypothetical protein [bacterium]